MKKLFIILTCFLFSVLTFSAQSQSIGTTGPTSTCGDAIGTITFTGNCAGCNTFQWQEGSVTNDAFRTFTVKKQYANPSTINYSVKAPGVNAYRVVYQDGLGVNQYTNIVEIEADAKPVGGVLTNLNSTTQFLNSGTVQLVLTGSQGTVNWSVPIVNNIVTQTSNIYAIVTNGICDGTDYTRPLATSNVINVQVFKAGTLSTADNSTASTDGSKVNLVLPDNYGGIIRWEYSIDGGTTWTIFDNNSYGNTSTGDKFADTHEIWTDTKFRVKVNLGPFSTGSDYTNVLSISYAPYSQLNADPTNGGNYIRQQQVTVNGTTDPTTVNSLTSNQKHEVITYLDGKGRAVQTNAKKGSPNQYDIIAQVDYDRQGRQPVGYLPYISTANDGAYRSNSFGEQLSYYANGTTDKVTDSPYPYSVSVFEKSPLGKLVEQGNVGQQWQPGGGHTNLQAYSNNVANDVRLFKTDNTSTFYNANDLAMVQTTDADQKNTQKFIDKAGRVVLSRVQLDETVNGVLVPWLETYYIYNQAGGIKYVISPKGVDALKNASWGLSQTFLDQYAYQYIYDSRGRIFEKKVPGQGWTYYCYDRFDRLVLLQDANNRALNNWIFIKYDRRGRAVMKGIYTNTTNTTHSAMQTGVVNLLYPLDTDVYYEERGTAVQGYTNQSFPTTNTQLLTVNYYDDYDFDNNGTQDYSYTVQGLVDYQGVSVENTPITNVAGLPTGSKQLIMDGGTNWLINYAFYDDKGHTIQVRSNNHLNPTVIDNLVTAAYDFEGKLITERTYHNAGVFNSVARTTTVVNKYRYDYSGRVTHIYQNNNGAPTDQLVVKYEYNELGQVVDKKLHETVAGNNTFLQSVDMRYSIQGWLTSINNAQLSSDAGVTNDETNDYFGMEFLYERTESGLTSSSDVLYNGDISATKWKGAGATSGVDNQHSYKFAYDKANRLKSATSQMNVGTSWSNELNALNESATYDLNGNILTLKRYQRKNQLAIVNSIPVISYVADQVDDLTYTYNSSIGDQLLQVTDATNKAAGFDNGTSSTNTDYTYENGVSGNTNIYTGNLTSDLNKGISTITYNYLGKVSVINFSDTRKIEYTYDAAGTKLTMKVYKAGPVLQTTTDYVSGFVYQNSVLSFFSSPEGRVVSNSSTMEYQYSIADNQGNTRLVFSSVTPAVDNPTATMEGDANDKSSLYNITTNIVSFSAANTTPGGSKVVKMNQTYNIGPARSVAVFPGDKVDIDVSEYHEGSSGYGTTGTPLTSLINLVAGAIGGVSGGAGDAGLKYTGVNNALNNFGFGVSRGDSRPAAYLNYILFDKDYNVIDAGYQLAPSNAFTKNTLSFHAQNISSLNIKEPGYIYAYLSYEDQSNNWVYFDDFKITTTKTNVIQYNEYYPFGLQINTSWARDNTTANNYLYNEASEINTTTGWYEMFYRNYDPAIGRLTSIDPYADSYESLSPYHYSYNNPVMFNDPSGAEPNEVDHHPFEWHSWDGDGEAFLDYGEERELQQIYSDMGMGEIYANSSYWGKYQAAVNQAMNAQYKSYLRTTGQSYEFKITGWAYTPAYPELGIDLKFEMVQTTIGWSNLSKHELEIYAQSTGYCTNCTSNDLGALFENIFQGWANTQPNLIRDQFRRNNTRFPFSGRTTVPDFTANSNATQKGKIIAIVPQAVWFELKAKYGGLYESSSTYQIRGHIDNLFNSTLLYRQNIPGWIPALHLVTTSDVSISPGISNYSAGRVDLQHHVAQFRIVNGNYEFGF